MKETRVFWAALFWFLIGILGEVCYWGKLCGSLGVLWDFSKYCLVLQGLGLQSAHQAMVGVDLMLLWFQCIGFQGCWVCQVTWCRDLWFIWKCERIWCWNELLWRFWDRVSLIGFDVSILHLRNFGFHNFKHNHRFTKLRPF